MHIQEDLNREAVSCRTHIGRVLQAAGVTQRRGGLGCPSSAQRQSQALMAKDGPRYTSCPAVVHYTSSAHPYLPPAPAGRDSTQDPSFEKCLQMAMGNLWVLGLHPSSSILKWRWKTLSWLPWVEVWHPDEFVHLKFGQRRAFFFQTCCKGCGSLPALAQVGLIDPLWQCHPTTWGL